MLSPLAPELIHELLVKFGDSLDPICARSKERRPEVQGVLPLPKAGTRNYADSCCIQQAQAIVLVRWAALRFGPLDRLLWEGYGWEYVH
jgi:hypothetical protein